METTKAALRRPSNRSSVQTTTDPWGRGSNGDPGSG